MIQNIRSLTQLDSSDLFARVSLICAARLVDLFVCVSIAQDCLRLLCPHLKTCAGRRSLSLRRPLRSLHHLLRADRMYLPFVRAAIFAPKTVSTSSLAPYSKNCHRQTAVVLIDNDFDQDCSRPLRSHDIYAVRLSSTSYPSSCAPTVPVLRMQTGRFLCMLGRAFHGPARLSSPGNREPRHCSLPS